MTSEGKSARELIATALEYHLCAEDIGMVTEILVPLIERESRLSIAAALERVIERLREVETPFTLDAKNDRVYLSVKETCQMLAHEFEKLTPEQVAHVRAEHDRAVRESLQRIANLSCACHDTAEPSWHGERCPVGIARRALASATETQVDTK